MALKHTITQNWSDSGGRSISSSQTFSITGQTSIEEAIPDSTTDQLVALSVDITQMKTLYMLCDQDILIELNASGGDANDISLKANEPVMWHTGSLHSNPIKVDILTDIYVTNSSGATANLKIEVGVDATV